MSLNWQYCGKEDISKWTDEEHHFFTTLIWQTMAADIGYLCEESVDEFVRRVNALGTTTAPLTREMCEKFYGITTNVMTLSAKDWALKHFANKYRYGEYDGNWAQRIEKALVKAQSERAERANAKS